MLVGLNSLFKYTAKSGDCQTTSSQPITLSKSHLTAINTIILLVTTRSRWRSPLIYSDQWNLPSKWSEQNRKHLSICRFPQILSYLAGFQSFFLQKSYWLPLESIPDWNALKSRSKTAHFAQIESKICIQLQSLLAAAMNTCSWVGWADYTIEIRS